MFKRLFSFVNYFFLLFPAVCWAVMFMFLFLSHPSIEIYNWGLFHFTYKYWYVSSHPENFGVLPLARVLFLIKN